MNDHESLRRLIALYVQRLDDGQFDAIAALLSEDAEFISVPPPQPDDRALPEWRVSGREAIVAALDKSMGPILSEGRCVHMCSEPLIDISGDRGTLVWDFIVVRVTSGAPFVGTAGRYHARVQKIDGAWRFTRRIAVQGNARLPEEFR